MTYSDELHRLYEQTTFAVELPKGIVNIRIGMANPEWENFRKQQGYRRWAILTAFNPRSISLSDEENDSRDRDLFARLTQRGFSAFRSQGLPVTSDWKPEAGYLIPEIGREEAVALGKEFDQNAVVVAEADKSPELLRCR